MTDNDIEFASPAWISAITDMLGEAVKGLDTGGRSFVISEEFTDAPTHLTGAGETSIGWHFTVTDDHVEVGQGALDTGDLVTSVDYHACLPVARLIYEDSPEAVERAARIRAAANSTGSRIGDERSLHPDLLARLVIVHNEMARITRADAT